MLKELHDREHWTGSIRLTAVTISKNRVRSETYALQIKSHSNVAGSPRGYDDSKNPLEYFLSRSSLRVMEYFLSFIRIKDEIRISGVQIRRKG